MPAKDSLKINGKRMNKREIIAGLESKSIDPNVVIRKGWRFNEETKTWMTKAEVKAAKKQAAADDADDHGEDLHSEPRSSESDASDDDLDGFIVKDDDGNERAKKPKTVPAASAPATPVRHASSTAAPIASPVASSSSAHTNSRIVRITSTAPQSATTTTTTTGKVPTVTVFVTGHMSSDADDATAIGIVCVTDASPSGLSCSPIISIGAGMPLEKPPIATICKLRLERDFTVKGSVFIHWKPVTDARSFRVMALSDRILTTRPSPTGTPSYEFFAVLGVVLSCYPKAQANFNNGTMGYIRTVGLRVCKTDGVYQNLNLVLMNESADLSYAPGTIILVDGAYCRIFQNVPSFNSSSAAASSPTPSSPSRRRP